MEHNFKIGDTVKVKGYRDPVKIENLYQIGDNSWSATLSEVVGTFKNWGVKHLEHA